MLLHLQGQMIRSIKPSAIILSRGSKRRLFGKLGRILSSDRIFCLKRSFAWLQSKKREIFSELSLCFSGLCQQSFILLTLKPPNSIIFDYFKPLFVAISVRQNSSIVSLFLSSSKKDDSELKIAVALSLKS